MSQKNPYKKGKSKLITPFMLEGKTNDEIYEFIKENKLDERFTSPITKRTIINIRWQMKSEGHLGKDGFPITQEEPESKSTSIRGPNGYSFDDPEHSEKFRTDEDDPKEDSRQPLLAQRRPDWDLLSIEQVNEIADPQIRQKILNYKTFWEQAKQEATPDYATKEQFDTFRTEIQENLQGGLNELKETLSETIVETFDKMQADNPAPTPMNPEVEVAGVDDVILPSMDLEIENPLEAAADSVIELAGSIISQKKIGFTSKSLLLFDLVRKKGFKGNLADFVNSSITSAMRGRKFKLVVEEDVE